MLIKRVRTYVNNKELVFNIPDKKSIILRGSNGLQVIFVLESLLSGDTGFYRFDLDKSYGFNYSPVTGLSEVLFNSGVITGMDRIVHKDGVIPRLHVIRYLNGSIIRSFLMSGKADTSCVSTDMCVYTKAVAEDIWQRVFLITNDILGFPYVTVVNGVLQFNSQEGTYWGIDSQMLVYLLVAECCLTPEGYHRVLLLPDISFLDGRHQALLIEHLDNIRGHSLCLSCGSISYDDISSDSVLSFINV